jgi:hypothetical protein
MTDQRASTQSSTLTKAQENELRRLAEERGKTDPDRGKTDPDRGKTDPDRGKTDPDRGMGVTADIFRRAAGLGGHLVVAFIAPVGSSSPRSFFRPGVPVSAPEVEAAAARANAKIAQVVSTPTVRPVAAWKTQASTTEPKD